MIFKMSNPFTLLNNIPIILFIVVLNALLASGTFTTEDPESWTGVWFPEKPESVKHKATVKGKNESRPMGEADPDCDDGKTNLAIDWDGSYEDYICLNPRRRFSPDPSVHAKIEFENIPKLYMAPHFCMKKAIEYRSKLPTFGPHRPLWPKYGEYKYVPKQRWIHTLEHGGIVALYHPCANLRDIKTLKNLVKDCLRRHVISPSSDLAPQQPFAILAWGVRFTMPSVNPNEIRSFIMDHALKGPEKLPDEGQYEYLLVNEAKVVSDYDDSKLCP